MGDRANICIYSYGDPHPNLLYLYTHWGGYELPARVTKGLKRGKGRWNDTAYLARILFCALVEGFETEPDGFGISAGLPGDNERPLIVVDPSDQTIQVRTKRTDSGYGGPRYWTGADWRRPEDLDVILWSGTFAEWIALAPATFDDLERA